MQKAFMSIAVVNGSTFARWLGARFVVEDDGSVSATVTVAETQEGPPGYAHGGALATLLDEAMGAAAWYAGYRVLAVHLGIDYKRPAPVGAEVRVHGQVERREGRKAFTSGTITLGDGMVAVNGSGIFVDAPNVLPETMYGFSFSPLTDK